MKKSVLTPAILIISMMMFPANANAAFWLDIVKEFVAGGIKTIVMPKKITNPLTVAESKPAPEAPKSSEPTPQDIYDALNKLNNICQDIF